MHSLKAAIFIAALAFVTSCGGGADDLVDGGPAADAHGFDGGKGNNHDGGGDDYSDAGHADTGHADAGPADTGGGDLHTDAGHEDAAPDAGTPDAGGYHYDLRAVGTSLYNGAQKLVLYGFSTYMWTDMKTHPWPPCQGWSVSQFADKLAAYNANLTRTFCIDTWTSTLFPWKKVNGKFDLEQFDAEYMHNLRELITTFGSRGIVVQLDLFDNTALNTWDVNTWPRHPFNAANGGPIQNTQDGRQEFYNPNPTVKALQDKYVRYMVQSLKDLKNVVFEVCNEYNGWGGAGWHNGLSDIIKSENPSVLVSANVDKSVMDAVFAHGSVDITTDHTGGWTTKDFSGGVNQTNLDYLRGFGKPTLLSSDGCAEDYAAQKDAMFNVAKAVLGQGFGVEFKDFYEPLAEMLSPLGEPIQK